MLLSNECRNTVVDARCFFLEDQYQSFFAEKDRDSGKYKFHTIFHPHTSRLLERLNSSGIDGLLSRDETQQILSLESSWGYQAINYVDEPYSIINICFDSEGAYSQYNWELFFHIPLFIAKQLSQNQQFKEAQKWFHYIFNPTDTSKEPSPERYWQMIEFFRRAKGKIIKNSIFKIC